MPWILMSVLRVSHTYHIVAQFLSRSQQRSSLRRRPALSSDVPVRKREKNMHADLLLGRSPSPSRCSNSSRLQPGFRPGTTGSMSMSSRSHLVSGGAVSSSSSSSSGGSSKSKDKTNKK